jgi:hypothetical protein
MRPPLEHQHGGAMRRSALLGLGLAILAAAPFAGNLRGNPAAPLPVTAREAQPGLPFGPARLPRDEFRHPPFTATTGSFTPENATKVLDEARANGLHLLIRLARNRRRFQEDDGAFSLEKWKKEVDAFRGVDFAPYVADGTILGHYLFDEPHDPTNWNGRPMPYSDIEAAAAYSKQLWPTMPTEVGSPPTFLAGGAPWRSLDLAFAQFSARKGELEPWLRAEVDAARRQHLGLFLSLQVLSGGTARTPMSGAQLSSWGKTMAAEPDICGLFMWRYDEGYFSDPGIADAVASIAQVAAKRSVAASTCRRAQGAAR